MSDASTRVVLVGAGGDGRDAVAQVKSLEGVELLGVVDDGDVALDLLAAIDLAFLGPVERLATLDATYFLSIADTRARKRLDQRIGAMGREPITVVTSLSAVSSTAVIGPGGRIGRFVTVAPGVSMGRHCAIYSETSVGVDVRLGDYVSVMGGSVLGDGVFIDDLATIGAGAVIAPGVTIGEGSYVGAKALVESDVPAGQVAVGVPATFKGLRE